MPCLRLIHKLRVLSFYSPEIETLPAIAADLRLCLLEEELKAACPGLNQVNLSNDYDRAQLFAEISWFVAVSDKAIGHWQIGSSSSSQDGEGDEDEEYEDDEDVDEDADADGEEE